MSATDSSTPGRRVATAAWMRSRSASLTIVARSCPVFSAINRFIRDLVYSMPCGRDLHVHRGALDAGRALGASESARAAGANPLARVPPENRNLPMPAAIPMASVLTSFGDQPHRVVARQPRGHRSAGGNGVQADVPRRSSAEQQQQFRADPVRDRVVHLLPEHHDALVHRSVGQLIVERSGNRRLRRFGCSLPPSLPPSLSPLPSLAVAPGRTHFPPWAGRSARCRLDPPGADPLRAQRPNRCGGLLPHLVAKRHHAALVGLHLHKVQGNVLVEPLEE